MNSKLTHILCNLEELHIRLLDTLKKKQQILISGETPSLLSILAEESKLIKKIKEEDQSRLTHLGEAAYKLSLRQLIERQPDSEAKQEWAEIHGRLLHLFYDISKINESNQQLLEQSLAYTKFMMEQLLPVAEGAGTYSSKAAQKDREEAVRLFDAKA